MINNRTKYFQIIKLNELSHSVVGITNSNDKNLFLSEFSLLINPNMKKLLKGIFMKSLLFLLFPIMLFAQNPYPDTLYLVDGRSFPCLVTGMNESNVTIIYSNERIESIVIQAIDRISMEKYGNVYTSDAGFIADKDLVNEFIGQRLEKKKEKEMVRKSILKFAGDSRVKPNGDVDFSEDRNCEQNKKWSFGVLYVPYYSGTIYVLSQSSSEYPPDTYSYGISETNMEGQFSYGIDPTVRVTLDIGYSSSYSETRNENHTRSQGGYSSDGGSIRKNGLNLLDISLGVKYYLTNIFTGNVTPYVAAGFGKQFAFVKDSYKNLFPMGDPGYITEDNAEEYMQDLNSPWHFNLGFGAEYFFNESLSLTANIRLLYSSVTAKYDYRYISDYETRTNSTERTESEFNTRVGLGLTFYF